MENEDVKAAYKENLEIAKNLLHKIPCDQGWNHDIPGLNGWIFENVISDFIKKEMDHVEIEPRPKLFARGSGRRARADLLVNDKVVIEAKCRGSFGGEHFRKLKEYKQAASAKGWEYVYITIQEKYDPYYRQTIQALGRDNAFFLDRPRDWKRFIKRVLHLLRSSSRN